MNLKRYIDERIAIIIARYLDGDDLASRRRKKLGAGFAAGGAALAGAGLLLRGKARAAKNALKASNGISNAQSTAKRGQTSAAEAAKSAGQKARSAQSHSPTGGKSFGEFMKDPNARLRFE